MSETNKGVVAPQNPIEYHTDMVFHRHMRMEEEDVSDDGLIRVLASTDAAVPMGDWREVLSHEDGAVDMSAARALLVNHNPDQIAGNLSLCHVDGRACQAEARVNKDAKMQSGIGVLGAVRDGSLRGVSIGYTYQRGDTSWNSETRTLRVNKWRLLEVSLTPIPADAAASVRSLPFEITEPPQANSGPIGDTRMSDIENQPEQPGLDKAAIETQTREAVMKEQREAVEYARSYGIDASDVIGKNLDEVKELVLQRARTILTENKEPQHPVSPVVSVGKEAIDKHAEAVQDAFCARVHNDKAQAGNPYMGRSIRSMGLKFARSMGVDTEDWSNKDAAHFVLGELNATRNVRDAANISSASFPNFVFLDAITKVVAKGYEAGASNIIYPKISDRNNVPDFKASNIGGMGTANLQQTAENMAFPELDKSEGVFQSQAKMWGGTLSLSLQALINDDTGQFERSLRMAGTIAQKTKEKRAIEKFLRGTATTVASTWTNNTTNGATIVYTSADEVAAARANIYRASVGLMNKLGLDGNPLGTMPRYLLCGPTNSLFARGLLQDASGQVVANSGSLELLVSPYFELSTLTGNSTTSYYLLADPMQVTGLLETVISGYENPQVQEYDAGAVGARKWKIWQPFEFDLFSVTNPAGTAIIPAAQQATT